jgi:putative salt-induced outer membrane protein
MVRSFLVTFLLSSTAFAQLQSGTTSSSTGDVSKGAADVGSDNAAAAAQKKDKKDKLNEVSFNLGGLFAAGNSRSAAVTAGVKSKIKRGDHQFTGAAVANYARAAAAVNNSSAGQPMATTVENVQALLRYDWFFAKHWSLFLQTSGRHDRFEGLDLRYQLAPGVAYYFIEDPKAQLWGEAGYDFQYDVRMSSYIFEADGVTPKKDADGKDLEKTNAVHNARLFLGFSDKLYKGIEFAASVEYLQDLTDGNTFRFVFDGGIKAAIAPHFALATAVNVHYENNPLPGVVNTDVIGAVSLVYNLF